MRSGRDRREFGTFERELGGAELVLLRRAVEHQEDLPFRQESWRAVPAREGAPQNCMEKKKSELNAEAKGPPRASVREPGPLSRANGAELLLDHFSRGWGELLFIRPFVRNPGGPFLLAGFQ